MQNVLTKPNLTNGEQNIAQKFTFTAYSFRANEAQSK